jgi:cell division protease FtsH
VKQPTKTVLIWGILILFMVMFYQTVNNKNRGVKAISFSDFIQMVGGNNADTEGHDSGFSDAELEPGKASTSTIDFVEIRGMDIRGQLKDGNKFKTTGILTESQTNKIIGQKIQLRYKKPEGESFWVTLVGTWLPVLLLIFLVIFFFKQ